MQLAGASSVHRDTGTPTHPYTNASLHHHIRTPSHPGPVVVSWRAVYETCGVEHELSELISKPNPVGPCAVLCAGLHPPNSFLGYSFSVWLSILAAGKSSLSCW